MDLLRNFLNQRPKNTYCRITIYEKVHNDEGYRLKYWDVYSVNAHNKTDDIISLIGNNIDFDFHPDIVWL
jgi:hypothetical protein